MVWFLFFIITIGFIGLAIASLFKPGSGKAGMIDVQSQTDYDIERLHRMQHYKFWRDFDK